MEETTEIKNLEGLYNFPNDESFKANGKKLHVLSHERLANLLQELSCMTAPRSLQPAPYAGSIRTLFCAINLELNERGLLAPRFRNMRRPLAFRNPSLEDRILNNDRQVIDLHWLYSRQYEATLGKKEYQNFFRASAFDFDVASRFASEKANFDTKAGWLKLSDYEAWQLDTLQVKFYRDRFRTILRGEYRDGSRVTVGRDHVVSILKSSTLNRQRDEKHVEEWATLWTVGRMLGKDCGPVALSRMYALAMGLETAPDPSQTAKRLVMIHTRIDNFKRQLPLAA